MIIETLNKVINAFNSNSISLSKNENKHDLKALKEWISETYPQSVIHNATHTDSIYIHIDDIRIRLSDHIQNNMTNKELYIVKVSNSDSSYMVMMNHSKCPYMIDNFDELKLFVKHYIMFNKSLDEVKDGIDASTKIKDTIISKKKKEIVTKQVKKDVSLAVDNKDAGTIKDDVKNIKFTIYLNRFNEVGYINTNWKAFEQQYLIKALPWYGNILKSDIRRTHMATIISRCANKGMPYQESLNYIGNASSIKDINELLNKTESFSSLNSRIKHLGKLYKHKAERLEHWDSFCKYFEELFEWYPEISKTNKNTLMSIYKNADLSTVSITNIIRKTYEEFGNMKWGACVSVKAKVNEALNTKEEINEIIASPTSNMKKEEV